MAVHVQCSKCNHSVTIHESAMGSSVKCPKCHTDLVLRDGEIEGEGRDLMVGRNLGHYHVERLLGEGGMGKVYLARNVKLNRTCALKILPQSFAKQDVSRLSRFVREAQAAANVEHTNVLPVYSIGNVEDTYFIEMQYVEGGTLEDVLRPVGRLEPRVAARIVRDVALGLAAAHAKGIIHRDIKPSNVMLTREGVAKIADFGVSKSALSATLTAEGTVVGTPLYMSPEQATGRKTDARSDIYSLGIVFFEMLTGHPPFTSDSPLPVLSQQASMPLPDLRASAPEVPPSIEAIVKKMTAKAPSERYQNCTELVKDLEPALTPVAAMTQIWQAREEPSGRPGLAAWTVATVVVVLAAAMGLWRWGQHADTEKLPAEKMGALPLQPNGKPTEPSADKPSAKAEAEQEAPPPSAAAKTDPAVEAAKPFVFWKLLGPKVPVPNANGEVEQLPAGVIQDVKYSPDGKLLAVAHSFGVDLWDTKRWVILRRLDGHKALVASIDFSPDGSRLATGSWDFETLGIVWEVSTGKPLWTLQGTRRINCVAFSPDGKKLAAGDSRGVNVWNAETGEAMGKPIQLPEEVKAVAFSADGLRLACGGASNKVRILDGVGGKEESSFLVQSREVPAVAFSPDGKRLAAGGGDGNVAIHDVKGARTIHEFHAHQDELRSLCFDKDGAALASAGSCGIALWHPEKGSALWRSEDTYCRGVGFSPDGKFVAVGHRFGSGSVKLLDKGTGKEIRKLPMYGSEIASVSFSPTEPRLLLAALYGEALDGYQLLDVESERVIAVFPGKGGGLQQPAFVSVGRLLVGFSLATVDLPPRGLHVRDIRTGEILQVIEGKGDALRCFAVSPDSTRIAYPSAEDRASICDLKTGNTTGELRLEKGKIACMAFSPDGKILAAGCVGQVTLWDAASGQTVRVLDVPGQIRSLAFSCDAKLMGCTSDRGTILWNLVSNDRINVSTVRTAASAFFTPDGRQLGEVSQIGTVRFWDVGSRRVLQTLASNVKHRSMTWGGSISCDGRLVCSASLDGAIALWRRAER